jgi:hypothetical protein
VVLAKNQNNTGSIMAAKRKGSGKKSNAKIQRKSLRASQAAATPPKTTLPIVLLFREQQKMRNAVALQRAQRYAAYLKQVDNPTEPPKLGMALRALAPAGSKRALRILAEGDSCFDYPLPVPTGDGVIHQLQTLLGYSIANMAYYGLEVEQMMGLAIRQEIISRLSDPNMRYDALLFSGGGNDLVGDQFCIWLKEVTPVPPPAQLLDLAAVGAILSLLEAEYRELIRLRDKFSPQTVIFVNEYDFPPVTGKGVCGKGPWLKPSLDYVYKQLGVINPNPNDEFVVVKTLLQQFAAMLGRIAADPTVTRFVVVPTQGTLKPDPTDWQNEIHPTSGGFTKIAKKFQTALAATFP